ncbi:O-antigen ligase family protein [Vibrio mimicus]
MDKIISKIVLSSVFLVPAFLLSTNNWTVVIIALLVLISTSYLLKNKASIQLNNFDWLVITALSSYFVINIPIAILDGSTLRYFQGGVRLLLCIPIYLMFSHMTNNVQSIRDWLSKGVILGSVGSCLIAIYQFFILEVPRVDGFLFSINFAYLACALTFLAFGFAFQSKWPSLLWVASALSAFATILTFSRGSILAIPVLLVLAICLKWSVLNKRRVIWIGVSLVLVSISSYYLSSAVKERVDFTFAEFHSVKQGDYQSAESSGTRLYLWKAAIEAYKTSPLIGLPYRDREELNKKLYEQGKVNEYTRNLPRGHAHSQYFEMLASTGSLGIVGIFFVLIVPFMVFIQHYRNTQSIWGYTGALFVAGFILYCLTEAPLQANLVSTFYGFMLATFFAMVRIEKYNQPKINADK